MIKRKYHLYPFYALRRFWHSVLFLYDYVRLYGRVQKLRKQYHDDVWLFSERSEEAADNGIVFFTFVRKEHPNRGAFYVIKNRKNFEHKVSAEVYRHMIEHGSDDHKAYFIAARVLISTHLRGYLEPWNHKVLNTIYWAYRKKKFVFLQHGVIKDDLSFKLKKEITHFDLFICGAKPEYDDIVKNYGYTKKEVKYTGLARYDHLHHLETKRQIVLMPTWREYIVWQDPYAPRKRRQRFLASTYYKTYQRLLNNTQLSAVLKKFDVELIFYPHAEIQPFIEYFSTISDKIIIGTKDHYMVRTLLQESALLITDYSSVFMDFAYMRKPVLYYQFDQEDFYAKHYSKGYFDYDHDGFGCVVHTEEALLECIQRHIENNFIMEQKYKKRAEDFFPLHDQKNCLRIYDEVKIL